MTMATEDNTAAKPLEGIKVVEFAQNLAIPMCGRVLAGMGADVFIRTGARTPLEYLLSPIAKNMQLGMREQ